MDREVVSSHPRSVIFPFDKLLDQLLICDDELPIQGEPIYAG